MARSSFAPSLILAIENALTSGITVTIITAAPRAWAGNTVDENIASERAAQNVAMIIFFMISPTGL